MFSDICRICLKKEFLTSIFRKRNSIQISSTICNLAKIMITANDGLPDKICSTCLTKLDYCLEFIYMCLNSDIKLRSMLHKNAEEKSQKDSDVDLDDDNFLIIEEDNVETCDLSKKDLREKQEFGKEVETIKGATIKQTGKLDIHNTKFKNAAVKQQCFTCGKVMSSRFRLKTHMRTHTGERPFSCSHCNRKFSLEQSLKVHMRVHTGEKPLQCSICGKSFAQSAGLATHKRKHTGQTPYQCGLCPRSFSTNTHLQYHVRRHTGEKNFECDTCNKAFITRSSLKQHILTHTGDRLHVCSVCGKRMARASHVKRHMQQVHHKNMKKNESDKSCPNLNDKKIKDQID